MKSAGKARNNGLYRHIRTSKEIIRNLLNDFIEIKNAENGTIEYIDDIYGDYIYELQGNEWIRIGNRNIDTKEITIYEEAVKWGIIGFEQDAFSLINKYTGKLINEGHPMNELAGKELMEKTVFKRYES